MRREAGVCEDTHTHTQNLHAGMLGSGIFVMLFGMGYLWDIHLFSYYTLVSVSWLRGWFRLCLSCAFLSCNT